MQIKFDFMSHIFEIFLRAHRLDESLLKECKYQVLNPKF